MRAIVDRLRRRTHAERVVFVRHKVGTGEGFTTILWKRKWGELPVWHTNGLISAVGDTATFGIGAW